MIARFLRCLADASERARSWFLGPPDDARTLGRRGEAIAARRLQCDGLRILARNTRIAGVEVDILAADPRSGRRVVVEVKTGARNPHPERRVDRRRLRRLERAANAIGRAHPVLIEVVAVDLSQPRPLVRRIELDTIRSERP